MPSSNAPKGDALLQRLQTVEAALGIAGPGAGGLSFPSVAGQQPQVFPLASSFVAGQLSVSGTSFVTVAGSPIVVATIGQSGDCLVEVGANISGSAAGAGGLIDCLVDGVSIGGSSAGPGWVINYEGQSNVSCSTKFRLSQAYGSRLARGSHTFTLKYRCALAGGDTSLFIYNYLIITPI